MGATNPNAGGAPGGGGKGGMGMNRGPGGNAQNNPGMGGGPQVSPMQAFANMNKTFQGLGSGGFGTPPSASTQGLTPISQFGQNPQPYQPSTGWVDGQPAQWAAQKAAMNNPAPSPQQGILDIRNRMLYGR